MEIDNYNDLEIEIIQHTPNPVNLCNLAANITMKQKLDLENNNKKIVQTLYSMNHTSIFEHVFYTILIKNVSRSFLAQITRHRMCSFTAGSQHYQDYSDYGFILDGDLQSNPDVRKLLTQINKTYVKLIANDFPKEEVRQILPNASKVNILWTINARSLINFLKLRLCSRNTKEILNFSYQLKKKLCLYFPELFELVGPECLDGKCNQGRMRCRSPYNHTHLNSKVEL